MSEPTDLLNAYLDPDERIVWTGAPTRRLFVFRGIDAFFMPFLLVWTALPVSILGGDPNSAFLVIPVLFLFVGFWGLVGRFLWDAWRRRATVYALTDRRAVILQTRPTLRLRDQPLVRNLQTSFKGAARGSVTFGEAAHPLALLSGMAVLTSEDGTFTFRKIEDPLAVHRLARDLARDG